MRLVNSSKILCHWLRLLSCAVLDCVTTRAQHLGSLMLTFATKKLTIPYASSCTRLLTPSFSLYRFIISRTSGAQYICRLPSRTAQRTNAGPAQAVTLSMAQMDKEDAASFFCPRSFDRAVMTCVPVPTVPQARAAQKLKMLPADDVLMHFSFKGGPGSSPQLYYQDCSGTTSLVTPQGRHR